MKIDLVHALPRVSSAYGQDRDGFSAAMDLIGREHEVRWLNVHPANDDHRAQRALIGTGDFVLVRSDWGWYPDRAAATALARTGRPCGLIIAGSHPPPSRTQSLRYDVLFYETPWYEQFTAQHPFAVQAFGIDTTHMIDRQQPRDIDWLFVGRLAGFKRPLRLLEVSGNRWAIGDFATADPVIKQRLIDAGVRLVDHVDQETLAGYYNRARSVLVPCELQGGGERAVLEARACGCAVQIAPDNPKLASLLTIPVPSHTAYAEQLADAIAQVLAGRQVPRAAKLRGYLAAETALYGDKLRRAPQTVAIRWRNRRQGRG